MNPHDHNPIEPPPSQQQEKSGSSTAGSHHHHHHQLPNAAFCMDAISPEGVTEKLFIPDEDPARFERLMEEAFSLYQPANVTEAGLVTDAVQARWFLWRRQRARLHFENIVHRRVGNLEHWEPEHFRFLQMLDRFKAQAELTLTRTLANLRGLGVGQGGSDESFDARWQHQWEIQKERLSIEREKLELAKAKDARLAPQQAAEALWNAEIANGHLQRMREQKEFEQQRQQAAAQRPLPQDPIRFCKGHQCWVIFQSAQISYENRQTRIEDLSPSNDMVRRMIHLANRYQHPPQFVIRDFDFLDTLPPEYEEVLADFTLPNSLESAFTHKLTFEEFLNLADVEDEVIESQQPLSQPPLEE